MIVVLKECVVLVLFILFVFGFVLFGMVLMFGLNMIYLVLCLIC